MQHIYSIFASVVEVMAFVVGAGVMIHAVSTLM